MEAINLFLKDIGIYKNIIHKCILIGDYVALDIFSKGREEILINYDTEKLIAHYIDENHYIDLQLLSKIVALQFYLADYAAVRSGNINIVKTIASMDMKSTCANSLFGPTHVLIKIKESLIIHQDIKYICEILDIYDNKWTNHETIKFLPIKIITIMSPSSSLTNYVMPPKDYIIGILEYFNYKITVRDYSMILFYLEGTNKELIDFIREKQRIRRCFEFLMSLFTIK